MRNVIRPHRSLISTASFRALTMTVAGSMAMMACSMHAQQRLAIQAGTQRPLAQNLTGATPELRNQMQSQRAAISVAVADFDHDGTKDLVTGYIAGQSYAFTLQRGVAAAVSPTGADWTAYTQGMLAAPFAGTSEVTVLPVRPDILSAVDVNGDGSLDVVVAAKGDSSAYLLLGDGKGGFAAPTAIALGGNVTAMSMLRAADASSYLLASVCGTAGCNLRLVGSDGTEQGSFALPAPATSILVANVNGSGYEDVAVVAGGKVLLFDGASLREGQASIDTLPVQNAAAISAGNFVWDRRGFTQIAVVDSNGTLHVMARSGLDSTVPTSADKATILKKLYAYHLAHNDPSLDPYAGRPTVHAGMAWAEVQTVAQVAPASHADDSMILLPGRFSGSGADDLAVASAGTFNRVISASQNDGVKRITRAAVSSMATNSGSGNTVLSAVAARMSPDAQQGTVVADGRPQAYVTMPTSHPHTYTVNTTADGPPAGSCTPTCSLRTAVHLVNADTAVTGANGLSAVDIINVPAGTYSLTYNEGADSLGDIGYRLPIDGGVSIVGAGSASTIIDAGSRDKVMSLNEGLANAPGSFDIFLSGLTLQNGKNTNPVPNGIVDGGDIDWDSNGTGNLTVTNCVITNGLAFNGPGGGIAGTNFMQIQGNGTLDIESSTISNSQTPDEGGGIWVGRNLPFLLNNSTVTGNSAKQSVNPALSLKYGAGGGINFYSDASALGQLFITASQIVVSNSTITNNSAQAATATDGGGGGIEAAEAFTMSGTTVSNNTAPKLGAGIEGVFPFQTGTSITSSNFTGNTTTASGSVGAAFAMDPNNPAFNVVSITYSRFHGNSANGNTTSGAVEVSGTSATSGGVITATNDWWGCNGPASGASCDTGAAVGTGATFTATPYTTLAVSVSSSGSPSGAAAFTATGSMAQNSAGTAYSGTQDNAYANLPATLVVTEHDGTAVSAAATALSSTDTIVDTVTPSTALTAPGAGTAKVTVDGFSVTTNFTLLESDLSVTSAHTGTFVAGSAGNIYTLTASNLGNNASSGTITVVDTLPTGFTATALAGSGWTCTLGTLTCTTTASAAAAGSLPAITLTFSVSGTDVGTYSNSVTVSGGAEIDLTNDTATDSTVVIGAPTVATSFTPTTIALNGTTTASFTITNPAANSISLTGIAFSDLLPTGLKVNTPNGLTGTCGGGTITATAASSTIALSGATLAPGVSCTFSVSVVGTTAGAYTNSTGSVTSTNGATALAATAALNVLFAPVTGINFGTSTIPFGGTTTLTLAVVNANMSVTINGIAFTNALPAGLVVSTPSVTANGCGGTLSAAAGATVISLSGGSLPGSSTCLVVVNVTGITSGLKTDSVTVSTSTAGVSNTATASVTVALPVSKLAYGTAPQATITAGTNAGSAITVQEQDSTNAVVSTAADTITLTVTGPNSYSQTYMATAVGGVATFNLGSVTLTKSGSYTYQATFGVVTPAVASETVNAAATAGLTVTDVGPYAAPGIAGNATVTAVDRFGNTATSYTGTVVFTSSDPSATLAANYTFTASDAGVHVFSITLNTAGTQSVTATDNVALLSGSATNILVEDAIWVLNANDTVVRLTDAGTQTTTAGAAAGTATLGAVAFDHAGNVWTVDNANSTVRVYSASGSPITTTGPTGAGVSSPSALAIDGAGYVWIANGSGTISVLSSPTAAVTGTTGYQQGTGNINGPVAITVDNAGSVWVANQTNNSVTQIIGGATPVVTPIMTGTTNNTLGTKP